MEQLLGTIRNGHIVLDSQLLWPDGTRITVSPAPDEATEVTVDELERLADELADELDGELGVERRPLPDFAVSRAGIYGDHC